MTACLKKNRQCDSLQILLSLHHVVVVSLGNPCFVPRYMRIFLLISLLGFCFVHSLRSIFCLKMDVAVSIKC